MRTVGNIPGLDAIEELVNAGMTHTDDKGTLHPQLADAVPSIENGLWKVNPNGTMETTWKIKVGAKWQDGVPVSGYDFLFAAIVEQDPALGIARNPTYDLIEDVQLLDNSTVLVKWKQPFVEANTLFTHAIALPMPRHLLAKVYQAEDKAGFLSLAYWTHEFVGAGPYRIREWALDSHMILTANEGYVLGRPQIDEIEIRFIPDPNTVVANLLAGAVDFTLGRSLLSVEQAQQVINTWPDAKLESSYVSWAVVHTQFIGSTPPIITDVRFRRALIQAIDRQQMSDTFMGGQSSVTHSFVSPDSSEYKDIESNIVRYEYDPRRSAQMIEGLGYSKGPDGMFVDAAGQKLVVPIQTTIRQEINPKMLLAVADYWKQVGVDTDPFFVPIQRINDRELRTQFPGFEVLGAGDIGISPESIRRYHSASTPLPENRFTVTGNNPRYRNAELDGLIERFVTTIPRADRMQLLGGIVHHLTDQIPSMGLFYVVDSTIYSKKLQGMTRRTERATNAWNAHEWKLAS